MNPSTLKIEERTLLRRIFRRLERRLQRTPAAAPPDARPVGVGLVGVGNVVRWAYLPRLRGRRTFRLRAVYDLNRVAARRVADDFGARACASLSELMREEGVEAVFVCTPAQAHCEVALAALEAGRHVLCEKPLGSSLEEALAMWEAARQAGTAHMVNFSYRFLPDIAFASELIRSGALGRVYHVWGALFQGGWFTGTGEPAQARDDATAWRFGPGGGIVLDLGSHLIDLCRLWFGEIEQVQAWTRQFRPGPPVCEDACGFSLSFKEGPMAHLLTSRWATGHKDCASLEVSGSEGSLVLDQGGLRLWTRGEPRWRALLVPPLRGDFLDAFHAAISGAFAQVPDFRDGLKNNEALEGVFRSARSGAAVALPLKGDEFRFQGLKVVERGD